MNVLNTQLAEAGIGAGETASAGQGDSPIAGRVRARSAEAERLRLLAGLFSLDCLCIIAGFLLAGVIRFGSPVEEQGIRTLAIVLPMFVALALNNRAYSIEVLERPSLGAARAVRALLYACAVAIVLLFYFKVSAEFSRIIFAAGTLGSVVIVAAGRWLYGHYLGTKQHWTFSRRLVIVDQVSITPSPGDYIVFADQLGIEAGRDDPEVRHVIGTLSQGYDSVVLACPPEKRRRWTYSLHGSAVDVEVLMPELARLGAIQLRNVHGRPTAVVSTRPLGLRDRILKRALDMVVASTALLLVAPLMLIMAVAIKIESPGPVFFRQRRMGENNRMFHLLKFRSMLVELADENGARSASQSDERITRVGRWMRRTSLDELPQLLNVLAGQMSIVGPRPHALGSTAEESLFWQIDRRYFQRHSIKPGMTGLAQVRGFRGATDKRDDLTNRLESDLEYVSGWTIWRDLKIIAGTFSVLVHARAF